MSGSIVSWLGIAIPLIVKSGMSVMAALKKSVKLSAGYEAALFLLVIESVAGGLIAWYVVLHAASWLVPSSLQYGPWYWWFLNLIGVLASAAVDPPLFIGLSLLADRERFLRSLPGSEQAANVDQLGQVVGVVVGYQQGFAEDGLAVAPGNLGKEVGLGIAH